MPIDIGTYAYQPSDTQATQDALNAEYSNMDYGHHGNRKWYRKYRSWADYWRDTTKGAMFGMSGSAPTDPMAQLQQQLLTQYQTEKSKTPNVYDPNYNFGGMINAQQQGMSAALRQRAAGLGLTDVYQPSINAAARSRQTLADQAMAAYRPQAWQANQQMQQSQDQLLTAMAQADFESRKAVEASGRSAG
jgi:hypothetical protein